ncbi:MAG: hypothetical protein KJ734_04910, partial [Chloroflexi bacterium]|nr:hypothetical protein [Chloroflexota bacterium]
AADRPHIHQAFDGWQTAGVSTGRCAWVRINPGRAYVVEVNPALSTRTDLPDNAPNTAPANWFSSAYTSPDDLDRAYEAAAVHEMADRVRAGRWYEAYLPLVARD